MEIAKALYKQARIVIMDEPTASLTAAETENLFDLICQLRGRNVAVIYISHRLDEIFQIADEVTVLRDGYRVLHCPIGEVTKEQLVKAMVGEEVTVTQIAESSAAGELLLEVQGLTRAGAFEDVSLKLQRGMIIGLAGALGLGPHERPADAGRDRTGHRREDHPQRDRAAGQGADGDHRARHLLRARRTRRRRA